MVKPSRSKNPNIAKVWDEYGHMISWDNLIDIKFSGTHGYAVVAWKEGDMINYADLAEIERGTWEVLNDCFEPITVKQWNKARCVPHCDELRVPEEDEIN